MLSKGVAGATVSVVTRDGIAYEHGYGLASRSPERAVDPARSLFRVGSISKTFTYIATMQLVEAKKIDLAADVNRYLTPALQVPDEGFGPVRVVDLMTHTAGFEDAAVPHLFVIGDHPVETLDAYLAHRRPHRVRPPGVHADYSNYSVALLGALVAHVSGEVFEDYIEKHVLGPLGMTHTTFREPFPAGDPRRMSDDLAADVTTATRREKGGFKDEPYEHAANIAPAGCLSSTAHDMTRWMRMLLDAGEVDGVRVLAPETFRDMVAVTFRNAPDVTGIAHGIFRARYGKYESLEHGGATLAFMSNMVVLPEAGVGVFVSTSTDTGYEVSHELPRLVFERLLPDARSAPLPPVPPDFATSAKRFAGNYVPERRAYTTLEKVLSSLQPMTVAVGDGALLVTRSEKTTRWAPEGQLTFRSVETGDRIEFLEGSVGIVGVATPSTVLDKVGRLDDVRTFGALLAVLVTLCLGVLVGAWGRRGRPRGDTSLAARWGALVVTLASATWLACLVMLGVAAEAIGDDPFKALSTYPDQALRAAVGLGYASSLLALAALVLFVVGWRGTGWTLGRRARHAVVVLTMVATALLLVRWNVLLAPYQLG
jgi:CubicO group peptidase (beta-lactamase class C family)